MHIEKSKLSEGAKVYIYPSSRKFYENEFPIIQEKLNYFFDNLEEVNAFFEIKYQRFIVIIISEKTPLSMEQNDQLVYFILALQEEFEIKLLDKVNVCFKQGAYVQLKEIPAFKKLIKNKSVSRKTIVFDNLINNKEEYENYWELPAEESRISHFFK